MEEVEDWDDLPVTASKSRNKVAARTESKLPKSNSKGMEEDNLRSNNSISQYELDIKLRSVEASRSPERVTSKSPIAGGKAISMAHKPTSLE